MCEFAGLPRVQSEMGSRKCKHALWRTGIWETWSCKSRIYYLGLGIVDELKGQRVQACRGASHRHAIQGQKSTRWASSRGTALGRALGCPENINGVLLQSVEDERNLPWEVKGLMAGPAFWELTIVSANEMVNQEMATGPGRQGPGAVHSDARYNHRPTLIPCAHSTLLRTFRWQSHLVGCLWTSPGARRQGQGSPSCTPSQWLRWEWAKAVELWKCPNPRSSGSVPHYVLFRFLKVRQWRPRRRKPENDSMVFWGIKHTTL